MAPAIDVRVDFREESGMKANETTTNTEIRVGRGPLIMPHVYKRERSKTYSGVENAQTGWPVNGQLSGVYPLFTQLFG